MSQPLPTGGFKWLDAVAPEGLKEDENVRGLVGARQLVDKLSKRTEFGYLLEVDVKYPTELDDSYSELPFMCEKMKINGVSRETNTKSI